MKTQLEWIKPTERDKKLFYDYFGKELGFSFENFKKAEKIELVKSSKNNIIGELSIDKIENITLEECEPKRKIHNKSLKLNINNKLYSLSSIVFVLKCPSCGASRRIHCNPARDLLTFKTFLCENCYKSEFYKTDEYRKKYTSTMINRHGAKTPLESQVLSKKIRETMIAKYGVPYSAMNDQLHQKSVDTTRKKYKDNNLFGHSMSEKLFALEISNLCSSLKLDTESCLNKPFKVKIEEVLYVVDFFIPQKNLIIEFFGDFFHGNPSIYREEEIVGFKGLTRREVNKKDEDRISKLLSAGFRIFVVWESDWKRDSVKVVNDIERVIHDDNCKKTFSS